MKLRKLLALTVSAVLLLSLSVSASASDTELFSTNFSAGNFKGWVMNAPDDNPPIGHKTAFFDGGVRLFDFERNVNYKTFIVPWYLTGMEAGKDYVVSFAGKAICENPEEYTMIAQIRAVTTTDEWINLSTTDGFEVEDGKGYPIGEDGSFKYSVRVDGEVTGGSNYAEGFRGLCVWGTYSNNPVAYDLYYINIVEAENFIPSEAEWEDLSPPADADLPLYDHDAFLMEDIPAPQPDPEPETEPETEPEGDGADAEAPAGEDGEDDAEPVTAPADDADEDDGGINPLIFVGIGAGVILIIILIVVVKKRS